MLLPGLADRFQSERNMAKEPRNLEELLGRIREAADAGEDVSLGAILEAVGRRSFGPMLLLAGVITLAPVIGDIPGMPTIMGLFVLLTAGQLLLGRDHFWLPEWLLKRSVTRDKLCRALEWLYTPARFIDRWLRPRLKRLVRGTGMYVVATACVVIALAMPAMEVVPFSANGAGAALTAFGLGLIARDGLLALIALVVTAGTFGVVIYHVL